MPQPLAQAFQALWDNNGSPPDVFAFLEQSPDCKKEEKLAILQCDQRYRWKTDQPLKVEDYLIRFPDLDDSDCKVELAVVEFQARQNGHSSPNVEAFLSRFSDISNMLRKKLSESALGQAEQPPSVAPTETFDSTQIHQRIGRYRLLRILGEGAFGRVWLGFDDELERQIAIKVPKPKHFRSAEDVESYLAEARMAASLDHPHIVPVYDMGHSDDDSVYVVSKFIEGCTLGDLIKSDRPKHGEAAQLLAIVAQALHHAHQKRLIHRDIKPANLLIEDATNTPYVADFGLAIKEEDYLKSGGQAGTPAYMSPEQVRGEGHRLDGRSDIFSLGIVFYELLTGERPFRGRSSSEVMVQISTVEPQPPRERDAAIPAELERICLKSLSKRVSDRYATAAELADDLRHWNRSPQQEHKEWQIVPKGLRSFDAKDSEFFLDLLPGPRNREGLPESIAFWKSRMEETDADKTFAVGLIYGPSGCGKSSLVKAGLLPRLLKDVVALYIEATPDETETRILRGLRKRLPDLSDDMGLIETFMLLRRESGRKVIIVLDQFEQWLHTHRNEQDTELVNALRQCDGGQLQSVVMVRDDFAMAAVRFMRELDTRIVEGHNFATVDLFDVSHAENVLIKFGQAFGKLPTQTGIFGDEEKAFVGAVSEGLAQDGKVVSVRLALFAEMVKGKCWTPATLEEVGGTEGVGVKFLEETFSSREANPEHRLHQAAAREVLKWLLPEVGSDIKGHMRSHAELLVTSGYNDSPKEFEALLRILDGELRLITPTDPEGVQSDSDSESDSKYYQLTHDYLVPSLREWLTRKQRETPEGRAELLLKECVALWAVGTVKPLPTLQQWIEIHSLTENEKWTELQQRMVEAANESHLISVRDRLLDANTVDVPMLLKDIEQYRVWVGDRMLQQVFCQAVSNSNPRQQLHASLGLLLVDETQMEFLYERLLAANLQEVPVILDALAPHKDGLLDKLWSVVKSGANGNGPHRLRAAAALAKYDPECENWAERGPFVVADLVKENLIFLGQWSELFRPVSSRLLSPLSEIFRDRNSERATERSLATTLLADYAADNPEVLADLLLDADEKQFSTIYSKFKEQRENGLPLLTGEIDKTPSHDLPSLDERREKLAKRQANAAISLLRLGHADPVWPLLKHSPDPRLRTWIIHRLHPLGASSEAIVKRLQAEPEISVRRALILALGKYEDADAVDRVTLTKLLLDSYKTDPDGGVHGAAEWVLRQWGKQKEIAAIDKELRQAEAELRAKNDNQRGWYINGQGQTFVILDAGEFQMGSPESEPGHLSNEIQHQRKIGRRIAISTKEVSKAQWRVFSETNRGVCSADDQQLAAYIHTEDSPMTAMTWFEAAWYCNWLSEQEGLPKDQWCYAPNAKGGFDEGMQAKDKCWELTGYRLPTEAEWEYGCRAGTVTSRYYGPTDELLPEYAWYLANGENRTWPMASLKPNDCGLFDMLGNALEWCQDAYTSYKPGDTSAILDAENTGSINISTRRVLRGGSFLYRSSIVRSADRVNNPPDYRSNLFGFRPSRTYN